ncbi:glycoside hydrolase family 97 protein [Pedobacter chitinilyticus]|uniref:Glycoside hydrolase family 97 protein n=1 Tax=Pedobacter chitinilyticus TaxID=2233776 RepID=A0A3S3PS75_9SPHI|nr:glycoside hydrolase family 97 protein [Pedobacter chitinilyticus]RWU04252.1 glycoside hydrolase family 97 protein [Pedobacter chitinilyticus]
MNKKIILLSAVLGIYFSVKAQIQPTIAISSPDKYLVLAISQNEMGSVYYSASYKGKKILENSPLGLISNVSDFSKQLKLVGQKDSVIKETYQQSRIKKSEVTVNAIEKILSYETPKKERIDMVFRVSNNDFALKYILLKKGETLRCIIEKELTGFKFPSSTTTFLTPQASPMIGWKKTKPSYEEEYVADEPIGTPSKYGMGYTFPGLFHVGNNGWALVSETGVSSLYCAAKLSEGTKDGLYTIAFPESGENNGIGSAKPAVTLPGETPWRTITIGDQLKPIVETTIPFDVIKPLYQPSTDYQFGRATWSWLEWQDNSMNYNDQIIFIDLAAQMGYEFILIDALWDTQVGYKKTEELIKYAQSKKVNAYLWYNSNGFWNDAPQGPRNRMNTSTVRKKEMAWMKSLGVKGIKVDFFGGDKQETIQLYEDILSDANDYGLGVIFHGCTLPRGWERMYPNFVSAEAVLASENLVFTQHANDYEAYNATLHPFIRNSVASMDFGPVLLNTRHNRGNNGGTIRKTTDIFQLATSVVFQSSVQNFGITPNNLTDRESFVIDFMKNVPTTWDETVFIDGYPGKYCVLARRSKDKWYIAGINAEKTAKKIDVTLPMLAGANVLLYSDQQDRSPALKPIQMNKNGKIVFTIQPEGGVMLISDGK